MPKRHLIILLVVVFCITLLIWKQKRDSAKEESGFEKVSKKKRYSGGEVELNRRLRKLWAEHIIWTRQYISDFFANSPSTPVTAERLVKNQSDIGEVITLYYGKKAGSELEEMLRVHILIAGDILSAMKDKKQKKYDKMNGMWHKNADDIAVFLNKLNPKWKYEKLKKMMFAHLDLTTAEAMARYKGKWQEDTETFDKALEQGLTEMADIMTEGIVDQYPENFSV